MTEQDHSEPDFRLRLGNGTVKTSALVRGTGSLPFSASHPLCRAVGVCASSKARGNGE